jgi:aspartate carbamoyltransferase
MKSVFSGRTIQVVRDLHPDEQWYLYQQTRQLKEALRNGGDVSRFRLNNPDLGMYLFFMEDSTRTKESFRNAGKFHGVKLNDFDAKNSSFQKKESITDTIKMLVGYSSSSSIFVVRSRIEGVCRWLEGSMAEYAAKIGVPQPAFINAGDGRHEHPTQEFLDEFSFLEQLEWKRDHIHIALVGDLFHGRTVHSKVDGLEVFREVQVDLIAPPELAMPEHYLETMKSKGFRAANF